MKRIILMSIGLLLALSTKSTLFAQNEFLPGWIITNQGDTLAGEVAYKGSENKVNSVIYRPLLGGERKEFTPEQTKLFQFIGGSLYESVTLPLKDGSQQVFALAMVKGKATLYVYGEQFFGAGNGLEPFAIEITSKEVMVEGVRKSRKSTQHIGLLRVLTKDCPTVEEKYFDAIKDIITAKQLSALFERYNACSMPNYHVSKTNKPWKQLEIGVFGGLSFSRFDIEKGNGLAGFVYLYDAEFEKKRSPFAGISFNFSSPRLSKSFSFQVETWLSTRQYQGFYETGKSSSYVPEERNEVFIDYHSTKIPMAIRYTYVRVRSRFQAFAQVGMAVNLLSDGKTTRYREQEYRSSNGEKTVYLDISSPVGLTKTQFMPWGGAGLRFRLGDRLTAYLEGRYELESDIFNSSLQHASDPLPLAKTRTISGLFGLSYQIFQ